MNNVHKQRLEDLVEYVMNYDRQENFRVFIYVDQREDNERTREEVLLLESKYIENIAVTIFQEEKSLKKLMSLNPFSTGAFNSLEKPQ